MPLLRARVHGYGDETATLSMHRDGIIKLPPPTRVSPRAKPIVFGVDTEPHKLPVPETLDEVRPLQVHTVVSGTKQGKLWNEFVARYHYLVFARKPSFYGNVFSRFEVQLNVFNANLAEF